MTVTNLGGVFEVQVSRQPDLAMHVCHFPVPAPTVEYGRLVVPVPSLPPGAHGALAIEALAMPHTFATQSFLLPPEHAGGSRLDPRWVEAADLPLVIPAAVEDERQWARTWRMKALRTPSTLGVLFPPQTIRAAAWSVLSRVPRDDLVTVLAAWALLVECDLAGVLQQHLAAGCALPATVRPKLLAAAHNDEVLFAPRCLRWLLCEIVAADEQDLDQHRQWAPEAGSDEDLMARAWFRCLRSGSAPTPAELLTAVWLLHEEYHGGEPLGEGGSDAGQVLALVSAVAFDARTRGEWAHTLDRWLHIWSVPDDHPSVLDAHMAPSAVRELFRTKVGIDVTDWLAGIWLIGMKWTLALLGDAKIPFSREDLLESDFEKDHITLTGPFESAFDDWLVGSIDDLRTAVRDEVGDSYDGLGSLPQTDSVAIRNAPFLELPNGHLVPLSLQLVAERATQIQRWAFKSHGGARGAQQPIGPLFEAWMHDQLLRLRRNHTILDERTIRANTTVAGRADAVVGYVDEYVSIEASLQRLPRGIATGDVGENQRMCGRYHAEADQAQATADDLFEITTALGLPRPRLRTILVVTEQPLENTPALQIELTRQRPDRNPRFLCSAAELEALVDLAEAGWSFPGAIATWQGHDSPHALSMDLARMHRYVRLKVEPSVEPWLAILVPGRIPAAA